MYTVETERLGFITMKREAVEAAMQGESELGSFLGLDIAEGLIEPIHMERVFPIRLEKLKKNPEVSQWYGFIVEKESETAIGMMGFKTPPDEDGMIEIGYGIHSHFQGKGYASEMALALKEWAFQQEGVKGITATSILKDNIASIKIVEKLGMSRVRENDGTVDYLVYKSG